MTGEGPRILKVESERALDRARGVAPREHLPEVRVAKVRRRTAIDGAVEQVADLSLEAQPALVVELEILEEIDVLAEVREPAHVAVTLRRVSELKRPRIRPAGGVVVAVL